jgi:hypothetical protein
VDIDAQQEISPFLSSGERLLWSGHPGKGIIFRKHDIFLIPFSLLWGGIVFSIFISSWKDPAAQVAPPFYFILPMFAIVGIYMIFGRFIVEWWQRSKTVYGLSDQRAIIVSGLFSRSARSINLKATGEIGFTISGDGTGTITFGDTTLLSYARMGGLPGMGGSAAPAFEKIDNVKEVYDMVQRTAQGR